MSAPVPELEVAGTQERQVTFDPQLVCKTTCLVAYLRSDVWMSPEKIIIIII